LGNTEVTPLRRRINVGCLGFLGACVALLGMSISGGANVALVKYLPEALPAPHTIARVEGRTSLRLAMVHDVLHERYTVHSPAYYERLLREGQKKLAKLPTSGPLKPAQLDAYDLASVALDKLQRSTEAVALMREKQGRLEYRAPLSSWEDLREYKVMGIDFWVRKLYEEALQTAQSKGQKLGELGELPLAPKTLARYRTLANLGTFLAHSCLKQAMQGDQSAVATLVESRLCIARAVMLNPGAHFGRETWQLVAINQLLKALKDPKTLEQFDITGAPLTVDPPSTGVGDWHRLRVEPLRLALQCERDGIALTPEIRALARHAIAKISGEIGMTPFDEPALGIVGMWTLGGGPNPHFSLALANIMDSVGQRFIAWSGYERTLRLLPRFWKDARVRETIKQRCLKRQRYLEGALKTNGGELRKQFDEELAFGTKYQQAYKDFEAKQIRAGGDPHSEGFYAPFFKTQGELASDTGGADMIDVEGSGPLNLLNTLPWLLLGIGLGGLLGLRFH